MQVLVHYHKAIPGPRTTRRAFSLLEMVMVLSTMGFIAAIAMPRLSSATTNSKVAALAASNRNLAFAMEMYAAEHFDRSPGENADGSSVANPAIVIARMTNRTDDQGNVSALGEYGPYLKEWPVNPVNGRRTLRIGAAAAGASTHGWYLPLGGKAVKGDHSPSAIAVAVAEPD